jgi:hypothetical protein
VHLLLRATQQQRPPWLSLLPLPLPLLLLVVVVLIK